MPIITTYKCDLCGTTQAVPERVRQVQVTVRDVKQGYGCSAESLYVLACVACCERLRLVYVNRAKETTPAPSLEEKLQEIVGALVEQHMANRDG